ncbi:MAG: branched-chain amino acid transport system substrate-binding protein, partial [Eubacteriaceae bacterium]|nr:branched-chain amino acid transport system substrate-binding protein [Eubacteriaceae bacterium]
NQLRPEVLGKKVELVVADNKSDKAEATTAAARLIEKDGVVALLGSWGSSLSIAAGDVVKSNEVPAVGVSCTNPQVTLGNDYYFRVCFLDPFQGVVMANYAYKNLEAKKVAIIQEVSNDYSVGLAKFFSDSFIELTGDENAIVETGNYNTGDQDFNGILTNIKAANPDVIFAPGNYTESALIIKQARALGITAPIIGGDTWETNEFITVGGADVEGAVMSTFFDDTNPLTEEGVTFVSEYKNAYPARENVAAVSALGYDAYNLLLDAIERAGSADPQAIRDALAETVDFQGATGAITIDENGDATKTEAIIKVVKDGKFTYLDSVSVE